MNIKTIENTIIERLKENIAELHIEGFPEKPEQFNLIHPKGAILVHYQGGNYSNTKSTGLIYQEKKLEFSITIVTRHLRSQHGAYDYIDRTRELLSGYQIDGCSKLYPTKENFLSEIAGIWQYSINFALTIPCIQIID